MKKFLLFAAMTAAAVAAASCNQKLSNDGAAFSQEIALRAVSGAAQTRSAINSTAFPEAYDMMVSAYKNVGSYAGEDVSASYFEGIQFTKTGDTWKSAKGAKYYPLDGTLDFLAVASAGYNTAASGIAPTAVWGASSNVAKQVVLTVPDNSAKFDDLLFGASNAEALSASGTGITFKHAMTSVVFLAHCNVAYSAVTNVGVTVDGITIDGAKHSGTLTVSNPAAGGGSGDLSAAWSELGSQATHVAARVWNSANLGNNASEPALANLNLTASSKELASYPFGEAYVILPAQAAVPFTVTYTIHNGFAADGSTPVNNQLQYQYTPASGTWDMGKKYVYDLEFTLTEIQINPTVVDWDAQSAVTVEIPEPAAVATPTFAGLQIAQGPLAYNGTSYEIKDGWNYSSYESAYGKTSGSTYFSIEELGKLFEKTDFIANNDGDIDNLLDPFDGWRLPTKDEWEAIITTDTAVREGATVNGFSGCHWAHIELTDVTYAGSDTPGGILFFPDGETITGKAISIEDVDNFTTGVTLVELNEYLAQGCIFLPSSGMYINEYGDWKGETSHWSSSLNDLGDGYFAAFTQFANSMDITDMATDYEFYCTVRLVKPAI